jgi:hypothetical protein
MELYLHFSFISLLHGFCLTSYFFTSALYLLYAKLEEEHGMARHAMAVYERATKAVLPEEMFEVRRINHFTFFMTNFSI